ncbi:MAG: 4-hydroxy-tetrahydrodipicolinate reductase [Verrucomicrobiota bacterium]
MATKFIMVGAKGRMGQAILSLARSGSEYQAVAEIDKEDSLSEHISKTDAVIEFSHHSVTSMMVEICMRHQKPLIIGTTGHSPTALKIIQDCAKTIPVVLAPNFSIGVNLLFYLTRKAAEILGEEYDQEVVEMHHRHKLDAPSGTGKRLAEILADVKKKQLDEIAKHGRVGIVGERTSHEIGVHALRGGDVVGDHTVYFATMGERIELTHRASSRDTFAAGALRAAHWVLTQKPGIYSMQDVLGLN